MGVPENNFSTPVKAESAVRMVEMCYLGVAFRKLIAERYGYVDVAALTPMYRTIMGNFSRSAGNVDNWCVFCCLFTSLFKATVLPSIIENDNRRSVIRGIRICIFTH